MMDCVLKSVHLLIILSAIINYYDNVRVAAYAGMIHFRDDDKIITPCVNTNGNLGKCIPLSECKPIRYLLRDRIKNDVNLMRLLACENDAIPKWESPLVCCTNDRYLKVTDRIVFPDEFNGEGSSVSTSKPVIPLKITKKPAKLVEKYPMPPYCGAVTIADKIFGGVETELNEFPWMVNLEYRDVNGELRSECAGSIINPRYVITAAHCVQGQIEKKIGKLESVRLGEHDTQTVIDCNALRCNEPYQRVGIEHVVVHENYGKNEPVQVHSHHDIALIRLDRTISFTDSIKAVCLPNIESHAPELTPAISFIAAGWGHNGTVRHTSTKHKIKLPFVDKEECRHKYMKYSYISDEQLCAGGVFLQDSCSGDSGGPLMRISQYGWILEGLVSFGKGCGLEKPGIYTRIRSYLDWIDAHITPW